MSRAGLNALQAAIFSGDIKTVVVWKLDRLARSQQEGINTLCDWCEKGVRLVSVIQQIDLSGMIGQVVDGVLFGLAAIEKQHIQERHTAGIAIAKKRRLSRSQGRHHTSQAAANKGTKKAGI